MFLKVLVFLTILAAAFGSPHEEANRSTVVSKEIWIRALGSTALISVVPFLILFFIPIDNSRGKRNLLHVLLAFASGGLLGDAFLHLIPHANHQHFHKQDHVVSSGEHHHHDEHHHHHDENGMRIGIGVLSGIIVFLIVEKFVRFLKGGHDQHKHHHMNAVKKKNGQNHVVKGEKVMHKKDTKNVDVKKNGLKMEPNKDRKVADVKKNEVKKVAKNVSNKIAVKQIKKSPKKVAKVLDNLKIAGYLNLVADFTHNFTDGLAIGASFLAGNTIGFVTTVTILLHEIPHELGDYAILLQSGCSKRKAMLLQLVTAIGALSGTAISLLGSDLSNNTMSMILPFTAGGFIYIALVSVIPELLAESSTHFKQSLYQIVAMVSGVYMMVLISQFE